MHFQFPRRVFKAHYIGVVVGQHRLQAIGEVLALPNVIVKVTPTVLTSIAGSGFTNEVLGRL